MATNTATPISEIIGPDFRAWLAEIGRPTGKTAEQVYTLWVNYCRDCRNFDQSPVEFEFLNWYRKDLQN